MRVCVCVGGGGHSVVIVLKKLLIFSLFTVEFFNILGKKKGIEISNLIPFY